MPATGKHKDCKGWHLMGTWLTLDAPVSENPALGSKYRVSLTIVPSVVSMYFAFTTIFESVFLTQRQELT